MLLDPEDVARFYRLWFPLLTFVNQKKRLVPDWPEHFKSVKIADAVVLRDALWADDALLDVFANENSAQLSESDQALVRSWRHRVAHRFAILFQQTKNYAVVLTQTESGTTAYGVLGLVSAPGELVAEMPVPLDLVLLPFEGKIIFDSIVKSLQVFFGPGIRGRLKADWRDVQDGRGVITALPPNPDESRQRIAAGNTRLLKAFRAHLRGADLGDAVVTRHRGTIREIGETLRAAADPLPLIEMDLATARSAIAANPKAATSIKRFARFLDATERGDPERVYDLQEIRRRAA